MSCQHEAHDDDFGHSHDGHGHGHGHSHGHDHSHDAEPDTGPQDSLFGQVLVDEAWCLNEQTPGSVCGVLKPWDRRLDTACRIVSDADEELLVYVPFNAMVKLKSVLIWGGSGQEAPSRVRAFANRDDLDFDNVGDTVPSQEWPLVDGATQPVEYPVRATKFSSVRSVALHVPANFGADETHVYYLAFRGDWEPLRENPVISVYELRPNVADHKAPAAEASHHSVS
ncbi:hypothetical protein H4R21_004531 [Coemansia helicoidea]|uniref:Uncharacterized protein n=1 Tax=Coemansia helicoidea TaxID=1286919 RepID=A0ACC1KY56_9FUNG|nr:hypothetical protein H4R21_004531 [Coemansia helicoidea]